MENSHTRQPIDDAMTTPDAPWLNHYDAGVPARLNLTEEALTALLDRAVSEHPKRLAVAFHNWKVNYKHLRQRAGRFAAGLRAMGVTKGDRVAVMLPNLPQTLVAYWGTLYAGATVVFVNPLYMEKELSHILTDCGAKVLVVLDLLWARHRNLLSRLPIDRVLVTRVSGGLGFPLNLLYRLKAWREGKLPDRGLDGERVLAFKDAFAKEPYFETDIAPSRDLAAIQYTGGTTGMPKGAMLTHMNLSSNARQAKAILHAIGATTEVFLGLLPFFHIYGLTVNVNFATANAATIVPVPRFDPLETLKAIHRHKPTIFPGSPSVYMALMRVKEIARYDLTSVRYCLSGSAPMPLETMRAFERLTGASILEGYGLTEASPVTHINPLTGRHKPGSIGLPFPDTQARVLSPETGEPLPPGQPGELVVKGPQVMAGYLNRPEDSARTLKDGWLHTGDVAVMDEEGYFYIVDRLKDLIISGGYNIYPREIEEVLHEHPKVAEAAVIGVPHVTRGEVVKAFVVPKEGMDVTREEIMAFCREKLANYKSPKHVEIRADLPKTFVGKVLKRELRAGGGA